MSIMTLGAAEPAIGPWRHEFLTAVLAHFGIEQLSILTDDSD